MSNSFNSSIFVVTVMATLIFVFIVIAISMAQRKLRKELKETTKITATVVQCKPVDDFYEQPTKMYEIAYQYVWKDKDRTFYPVYPTSEKVIVGSTVELPVNKRGDIIFEGDIEHFAILKRLFTILSAFIFVGGTILAIFAK